MTLVKLREDIQPISEWISKTSESALGKEADKETYYGGYAMLYELMDAYAVSYTHLDVYKRQGRHM